MAEKRKRQPYICACGFETHFTKEWRGHLFVGGRRDGKGVHHGVKTDTSASVKTANEYATEVEQTLALARQQVGRDNHDNLEITDDELFELAASRQSLENPVMRNCIIIRPNYKGGIVKEKLDVRGYDLSKCIWREYGIEYPVFVDKSNGHKTRLVPFENLDEIGESPYHLYEAANPVDYRELCKYHPGNLEKIRLGLMILLVFGTFLLIYLMSKGGP